MAGRTIKDNLILFYNSHFGRTKARLSLQFKRHALITRRFEHTDTQAFADPWRGSEYTVYIPTKKRIWAEAVPVGKGRYEVKEKILSTCDFDRSILNKYSTSFFSTRDEAIAKLKSLEARFEQDGERVSVKQPFKKRIYTKQKQAAPKAS